MKTVLVIIVSLATVSTLVALGHTTAESNAVVRAALNRALVFYPCDLENFEIPADIEEPNTWHGFLGGDTNGWTFAEKKAAFDWYLSTLGTKDCKSLDCDEQEEIRIAVGKCDEFNYTNSASAMKALALNPRGVCRGEAIDLTIRFSLIDDSMNYFVESIMTNSTGYSLAERGVASCRYASRLLAYDATNNVQQAFRDRAVNMFYRNRMLSSNAFLIVDGLFVQCINGYEVSSNRLEHALNAISLPSSGPITIRRFTSVTNQLLSSGQPLVQLDIGEGGD